MENTGLKVLVHTSAFFAPFLVPFIVYLIATDEEVKKLSVQAILFQIALTVLIIVSFVLAFFLVGIPLLIVFAAMGFIVPIIGIVKAVNHEKFNYPIVGGLYR
ncbi:DUF4870 domain-containing protein [Planococcus lenghuensis]|uniref:DUF4870 domain-containing protein n=1 Tax=Planococcus lenghuensis TaxID=2213202 RepID=A0A1Q2KV14_9BACL|nr:DUF4870 domain-containing protein [Planococcus lenghuensis]AQQ51983.1 hypothetical protein B0X71_01820 [Planococcus lenghuensis]